jgi:hypothetical protein
MYAVNSSFYTHFTGNPELSVRIYIVAFHVCFGFFYADEYSFYFRQAKGRLRAVLEEIKVKLGLFLGAVTATRVFQEVVNGCFEFANHCA